jgi:RNA polymerase sigma factor (sigma-70 family)
MNDRELLHDYVKTRSESAFSELAARHLNLVYATALRVVADPRSAEEVAQSVFIQLARKAQTIRDGNALSGWLYRSTCGLAKDHLRGERRRRERENEAMTRAELDSSPSQAAGWESVAPLLEDAMQQLNEDEQNAVVLRFFEDQPLAEIGRALDISEDAAQKRVRRALDKLRSYLVRQGVTISAATLATALVVPSTHAAPPALLSAIGPAALATSGTLLVGKTALLTAPKIKVGTALLLAIALCVLVFILVRRESLLSSSSATFHGVGDLSGGQFISYASGVSGDGAVVVGLSASANGSEAFRWTARAGMVPLGDLPGGIFSSGATGASADGTVIVGGSSSTFGSKPFRWTQSSGMTQLVAAPGDFSNGVAYAVSGNGQFIVGECASARAEREAFRWQPSATTNLGSFELRRFNSQAMGVSDDGSVVIGNSARTPASFEAFRWTQANGMIGLGDFAGGVTNSNAYGVSPDGRFVVGYGCPGTFDPYTHEAFRWTSENGLEHLGFAPGTRNSAAYAVSADGNIIVGDNKSERPSIALIWTPQTGMRALQQVLTNDYQVDLKGWQLTSARGVSHDGRTIVGSGLNPSGQFEGWIASFKTSPGAKGKP